MISAHRKSLTKLILDSGRSAPRSSSRIQFKNPAFPVSSLHFPWELQTLQPYLVPPTC